MSKENILKQAVKLIVQLKSKIKYSKVEKVKEYMRIKGDKENVS